MCSLTIGKELLRGFGGKAWELGNGLLASAQVFFIYFFFLFLYGKRDLPDGKKRPTEMQTASSQVLRFFCLFVWHAVWPCLIWI